MALALALAASGLLARSAAAADTSCELAIIGGGPGGLYTAWRLAVDTKTVPAASICIFERAERVDRRGRAFAFAGGRAWAYLRWCRGFFEAPRLR